MTHCQIKLPVSLIAIHDSGLFGKLLHLSKKSLQRHSKMTGTGQDLPGLTLSFQLQKGLIAAGQLLFQFFAVPLDQATNLQKIFLVQRSTVHLSGTLCQVVGLVYQKQIIPRNTLTKKAFQIYIRIKYIIVIADHTICPGGQVQTKLKGTHMMFLCRLHDPTTVDGTALLQQGKDRIIDPVKMSCRIGTDFRIALRLF